MTGHAEGHIVGLVFHQQSRLGGGVRLVAGQAVHGLQDLGQIRRVHNVADRMSIYRVIASVLDRQDRNLPEIILRQFYLTVEDGHQMFFLELFRIEIRTMTLETKFVGTGGAEQMRILSAMCVVASAATLVECRLMQMRFLELLGLIAMTGQAGADRVRL